jgi:isopenicillin N synthase-like dioxygenase
LPAEMEKYRGEIDGFRNKCYEASLRVLDVLGRAFDVRHSVFSCKNNTH